MEAAIRSSVQVGGPPPGQRAADTGPSPQQTAQAPPPTISYQQRIPSGASPIHRPVDTPQPYSKGGAGPGGGPQQSARSAASPLSPPRPGPGAANTYPRFADVTAAREAPHTRYVHQSPYGVGQVQQYRENPYARIPQVPAQVQDYHRAASQPVVVSSNSNLSVVSVGPTGTTETAQPPQIPPPGRQRISLIPPPQHPSEYMSSTRPAQAPPDPGGQPFKKLRLGDSNHPPSQQLKVDTRDHRPATTEAYHPQVEAISPTLPNDTVEERRTTKDDLLLQIHKVDMEIVNAENTMAMLKKKEETLEEASAKPSSVEEPSEVQPKHRSLAQKIYAENRKRAAEEHSVLASMGPSIDLPLYNQPSDVEICQEIIQRHQSFKSRLLLHLRKVKSERAARNAALVEKYAQLSQEWLKRVEKAESSAKRKAKEAKNREFFEKVFTELRKQREDKERFNRVGSRIKSEADLEEIMDGLQEQALEDKKMRSYAVIPPLMFDPKQRKCVYSNENGALPDMVLDFKERQNHNVWTVGEKEIFKEKFLQHPKNFGAIAASLDRKSAQDCVRYYYLSKKTENYKQLLRKSRQRTRSSRNPQKSQQAQAQCIVDSLTTGVTTRLQREQQQKTGGRDRAAQSTTSTGVSNTAASGSGLNTASTSCSSTTTSPVSSSAVGVSTVVSTVSNPSSTTTTIAPTTTTSPSPSTSSSTTLETIASGTTTTTTIATTTCDSSPMSTTTSTTTVAAVVSSASSSAGTESKPSPGNGISLVETATTSISSSSSSSGIETITTVTTSTNGTAPSNVSDSTNSSNTTTNSTSSALNSLSSTVHSSEPMVSGDPLLISVKERASPATSVANNNNNNNNNSNSNNNNISNSVSLLNSNSSDTNSSGGSCVITTIAPTPNGIKSELVTSIANSGISMNDTKALAASMEKDIKDVDNKMSINSVSLLKDKTSDLLDGENGDNFDVSQAKKKRLDSDASSATTTGMPNSDGIDGSILDIKPEKLHPCFICKNDSCPRTRPLKKGRGPQYGIPDEAVPSGARVCNSCQCKSVRSRYPNCPLPNCPNPKDRAKRLHNLPPRLYEMTQEMREQVLLELQIPTTATRCCSACLMRIRRKIDPHANFTEEEQHRPPVTDGDESDLSTSSCEDVSSDTASAESPNNPRQQANSQKDDNPALDSALNSQSSRKAASFEDDRLLPPLGQAPRKQKTQEEYDSSATETADEENENSPANRQSPKVILHPSQTTVTMVPPSSMQNGPPREQGGSASLNVREIVFNFIERSLKTTGSTVPPPKPGPVPLMKPSNAMDSRDISFVREYRNELPPNNKPMQQTPPSTPANMPQSPQIRQMQSQAVSQAENLATLSVVNSHSHAPPQLISHQHGITATITPVQSQPPQQQPQSVGGVSGHEMQKEEMMYGNRNEPEPQTLDLSIKKPSRDVPPHLPPSHPKPQQHPGSSIPMYRNDAGQMPPGPQASYIGYHHPADMNRPTKSPSVYVSQVPVPISMAQSQVVRSQQQSPQVSMAQHQQHQVAQQLQAKPKVAPKLSPKIHQQAPSPSQMVVGGPKGSITHGTPVNSQQQQQQQILVQGSSTLSPRFDPILRQTPPSGADSNKLGSITQGTPVHLPTHHLQDKQRVYEYYKSNRQSPAQQPQPPQQPPQPQQSSPQTQNFVGSAYARSAYAMEQSPQLSSRQIVMHDYITSQQMHGQQGRVGRSDKESPSPRSSAHTGSPAAMYYADKDRGRADYLSRTSPAEHVNRYNNTPSPHRTPPPQRQGVIQRHNTGGSKPPSPSPNRLHIMQHHYPPPGHEAFSSFVDVAVQQPQLPVPQKDEKRNAVSDHPVPPSHHEMRYHQHMAREQMAMQMHQQQQQQHFRQQQAAAAAVVDMQRRQDQYNRERIHVQQERERERQERERVERHNQERLQAERERMERERERERERQRERERAEEQEREERRRETARLMASGPGGPPFLRGDPPRGIPDRERDHFRRGHANRPPPDGATFSAASLIDAIIKHSINQGSSDPPPAALNREGPPRQQFYPSREQPHPASIGVPENNGKANSPNVINIDLDADRGRQSQIVTKSITLGELTDSIITKDYGPNPMMPLRTPYIPYLPDSIVTTDQWKYNRRMQQKEADAAAAAAAVAEQQQRGKSSSTGRSNTPDERQIIRMAQPPSPRNKFHELVMPPEGHFYQAQQAAAAAAAAAHGNPGGTGPLMDRRMPGGAGGGPTHQFALDCYVKNRIVEAMRTEDERRPDDVHMHGHHERNDHRQQGPPHGKDMSSDGPQGSIGGGKSTPSYEDDRRSGGSNASQMSSSQNDSHVQLGPSQYPPPQSQQQQQQQQQQPPPVTTFATTTYTYPFNALNVSGPPPTGSLGPPQKNIDGSIPPMPPQQSIAAEPKPLLSSQYEALSDED